MDSLEYSAESRIDQLLSFNCLSGCLHVFILDIDSISEAWWLMRLQTLFDVICLTKCNDSNSLHTLLQTMPPGVVSSFLLKQNTDKQSTTDKGY